VVWVVKDGVPVVQATGRTRPVPAQQPTSDSTDTGTSSGSGAGPGVEPENPHD
jgi:hypothetical protein